MGKKTIESIEDLAGKESRAWVETLPVEKKAVLLAAGRKNPAWNFAPLSFPVLWFASAGLMAAFPAWPVQVAGTIAIAYCIHGLWNLMHKGTHGNITYNPRVDRLIAFLAGLPALFSVTAYQTIHLVHHDCNRLKNDPQDLGNLSENPRMLSVLFYALLLAGTLLAIFLIPVSALNIANRKQRRDIWTELILMVLIYAGVLILAIRFNWFPDLAHYWLIPLLVTSLFGNVRAWAEHGLLPAGDPLTQTRTITSSKLVSFLFLNANYHLEHHLFPGMPWYRLPEVHRLLREDYAAAGTSIYRSYLKFLWQAARIGVHGYTPKQDIDS